MQRCLRLLYVLLSLCLPAPAHSGIPASHADAGNTHDVLDGATLFRLGKDRNLCALTFDDGPGLHTERLLDILQQYRTPATFFVVGSMVKRRPRSILRMAAEGHEIANHTLNHRTLRRLSEDQQREEVALVQQMLFNLGVHSYFLRPPFGRYDIITEHIAKELKLRIVLWSVDSHDWKRSPDISHLESVGGGQGLRGVFLFHDTLESTVESIPEIINALQNQGCRFVTLSEYIYTVENMDNIAFFRQNNDAFQTSKYLKKIITTFFDMLSSALFRFSVS